MRVLILGGTVFLGRHLAEELRSRGHEVVLFNRGKSNPRAFPDIEQLHGDRTTDLARIGDRQFDAVIDTCGYLPKEVQISTEFFRDRATHYTFISSISVYDLSEADIDERSPLLVFPETADPSVFESNYYGELKVLCEETALRQFGASRTLIVRPGLIVGPHDPTDRFSYWPHRFTYEGKVAAPCGPQIPAQFIDVRDLASWTVGMLERCRTGAFSATSQPGAFSLGAVLDACRVAATAYRPAQPQADEILWMSEAFLQSQGISGWIDLPLWMEKRPNMLGLTNVHVSRAWDEGLRTRPLANTVQDTLAWILDGRGEREWKAGLSKDRERALVSAFLANA